MADVGYDMYMKLLNEAVSRAKGETSENADMECLLDVQIEAYIPDDYISNLNRRLEIYRRIADIQNESDAGDVIDELADRFGDIPKAVNGLINIALLRSKAKKMGIYEIRQQNDHLIIYVKQVQSQAVADIIGKLQNRAVLRVGEKPHISVSIRKSDTVGGLFDEIFGMHFGKK